MKLSEISPDRRVDLACLGRLAVDLYAQQPGSRLEDVSSFAKYLGGSSANIAFGAARLGLRAAMISRVGDEQMGRFLTEALQREGCDTSQVQVDPQRLTALVLLALKDRDSFPLLFYRHDCADMALDADCIDEAFIAQCRALLITGTHLSTPTVLAASQRALAYAQRHRVLRVLDIDYRPVLWGLTAPGEGANRYVADAGVTQRLQALLPGFDLLIGTEEEFMIAGGVPGDVLASLSAVRAVSDAAMVVKLGAAGCCFIEGAVPARLEDAPTVRGERIEVMNVLGAGDAFAAGLMSELLRGQGFEAAARIANACGAIVVSRHACAPAMPTPAELAHWFSGSRTPRVDADAQLAHLHRSAGRQAWPALCVLAFDHRSQFFELARQAGLAPDQIAPRLAVLKRLLVGAAERVERSHGLRGQVGVLIDDVYGEDALASATGRGWWVGRPVELPGSRPLRFEHGPSVGSRLAAWPADHVVKCLVHYHPDDAPELRLAQEQQLRQLWDATRASGHELLLEVITPPGVALAGGAEADPMRRGTGATASCSRDSESLPRSREGGTPLLSSSDKTLLRSIKRLYNLGFKPEWWKLAPMTAAGWAALSALIAERDPCCRGAVILGLNQPIASLVEAFAAARDPIVKGYMVGRTLWAGPALAWLRSGAARSVGNAAHANHRGGSKAQDADDEALIAAVAANFSTLVEAWRSARSPQPERIEVPA